MGLFGPIRRLFSNRRGGRARRAVRRRMLAEFNRKLDARLAASRSQWEGEDAELRQVMALASGAAHGQPGFSGPARRSLSQLGGSPARPALAARYDGAQTTDDNSAHWLMADHLAADAANSPSIRRILRSRARYEVANNCYCRGVGESIANDLVGTGPRLHIDDERLSPEQRAFVEGEFAAWFRAIRFAEKLRTLRKAKRQDGEGFAVRTNNPTLATPVKLDIRLIEAEQVASPKLAMPDRRHIDGIDFDADGNPVQYHVLEGHPGDPAQASDAVEDRVFPAGDVFHWFRADRPGQHRGLPEFLPAFPLYSTLRRYTQASLDAAETAADYAVLLETQSSAAYYDADGEAVDPEVADAFTSMDLKRRMMVALPQGYTAKQMQPQHPGQEYSPFKREICGEIGRCENVSLNVVLGDSSQSNFASGTLDHTIYFRPRAIERDELVGLMLERLLGWWLDEAALIEIGTARPSYLPQVLRTIGAAISHSWHWDSNELGDPLKLAIAKKTLLASGQTTIPELFAQRNVDWRRAYTAGAASMGVSFAEYQELVRDAVFAGGADTDTGDDPEPGDGGESGVVRPKQGEVRRQQG
ncbi:MAG TPA: phage portal protein [Phycisphaerae bacterium]|nr:phage portal protein [Phycisphaerae bacterium]